MPAASSRLLSRRRKRLRRPGFDYGSCGAYFVTIVTQHRVPLFGRVAGGRVQLQALGLIVRQVWHSIPSHRSGVVLDAFVIMPDHLHGIIVIEASPLPLGRIVNLFKAASTRAVNRHHQTPGAPLWQRGFHDRIIRNADEWVGIARYIDDNPRRWREPRQSSSRPVGPPP